MSLRKDRIMRAYLFAHPRSGRRSRLRPAGLIWVAILFVAFSFSCRGKSPEETGSDKTEPNATVETGAGNVAVTVNGVDIAESRIEKLIKPQMERMAKEATQLPPEVAEQYRAQLRQDILEQLVYEQLLEEKVIEANIVVTETEVDGKISEIAAAQQPPLSLEDFKKKIGEYGLSFDDVKEDVRNLQ